MGEAVQLERAEHLMRVATVAATLLLVVVVAAAAAAALVESNLI